MLLWGRGVRKSGTMRTYKIEVQNSYNTLARNHERPRLGKFLFDRAEELSFVHHITE